MYTVLLVHDHLINSLVVTILRDQILLPNCPAFAARTALQNWPKFYVIDISVVHCLSAFFVSRTPILKAVNHPANSGGLQ